MLRPSLVSSRFRSSSDGRDLPLAAPRAVLSLLGGADDHFLLDRCTPHRYIGTLLCPFLEEISAHKKEGARLIRMENAPY
jgi:hypothetical protein